jgi:hypothetical protein
MVNNNDIKHEDKGWVDDENSTLRSFFAHLMAMLVESLQPQRQVKCNIHSAAQVGFFAVPRYLAARAYMLVLGYTIASVTQTNMSMSHSIV